MIAVTARGSRPREVPVPVELAAEPVALDDMADLYSLEVSLAGMVIPTARRLPVGSVVTITVQSTGGLPPLRAIARVCEHLEADPHGGRAAGLRLEFLDVRPESAAALESVEQEQATEQALVLVVDDDNLMRGEAEQAMQRAGHRVLTARNGVEALSLALSEPIDLILTDVTMPSMDGWQLLRLLRSRTKLAKLPVIFLTRLTSDVERLKGYELGVSDYVDKPFHVDDLNARVDAQLARGRSWVPSDAPKVLRGDLGQVALASLLSLVEMERRTGVLRLAHSDEVAVLYIRRGTVVDIDLDAPFAAKRGLDRFFHVLDWSDGIFELSAVGVERPGDLEFSTSYALLAHAKHCDEQAAR